MATDGMKRFAENGMAAQRDVDRILHSIEPIEWPAGAGTWWWMRCRKSRRAKWRVLLVRFSTFEDKEWVSPLQNDNAYSRGCCESLEASFVPAVSPPEEWCN